MPENDHSTPRLDMARLAGPIYQAMAGVEQAIRAVGLDDKLLELVRLRCSQINGCAFCLDMHSRALREAGETTERLDMLPAWDEVPHFSERERAALALAEAATHVSATHVPDDVYERAAAQFDERELAALIWSIASINTWNRVQISARSQPAGA